MIGIITGDIINSRKKKNAKEWLGPLKKLFHLYGKSPKVWEVFRGDSFQLEIKQPEDAILAALSIKACIKSIKGLDVRMAIGLGNKVYNAPKITESNGDAFIFSGEKFEGLKKTKQNLAIKTIWEEFDIEINLMLSLASIAMDKWSAFSAEFVTLSIDNKTLSQKELGDKIGISQSSVSERQKRAHYGEIMEMELFYRNKIKNYQLQIK